MRTLENGDYILNEIEFERGFDFSKHTTYGLGGKAKIAYFPKNFEEVEALFAYISEKNIKYVVLGGGSNVLASDKYFDGAVISTRNLNYLNISGGKIICGAGVMVPSFLKFCIENGAGGYEYLAGIPASLGGITYMNGGVPDRHIGDDIISVKFFNGKICDFSKKMCGFGNKYSTMQDINGCILQIELPFKHTDSQIIRNNIKVQLNLRGRQPKGKNCGCVFKNPLNFSAGKLIDKCGLKGLSFGGAQVAKEHANFIVNNGGTAEDVYKLISLVKSIVFKNTGVELEEEVVYIGEFNDFNG